MEYHAKLTPESFKKAATQNADINHVRIKLILFCMIVIFIVYSVFDVFPLYKSQTINGFDVWMTTLMLGIIMSLIIGGLLGFMLFRLPLWSSTKVSAESGAFDSKIVKLEEQGIYVTSKDGGNSFFQKSRVYSVYETNNFFIVKVNKFSMVIFEKNRINPEGLSEIKRLLSLYLNEREIIIKNI